MTVCIFHHSASFLAGTHVKEDTDTSRKMDLTDLGFVLNGKPQRHGNPQLCSSIISGESTPSIDLVSMLSYQFHKKT